MIIKESVLTRREIEAKLATVGDYVKMDLLQAYLKKQLDFDTRRFALVKLSAIYESRGMYLESAKLIRAAADINTTYEGKMNDFVKAAELFIRACNYEEADISISKAHTVANEKQKVGIKIKIKDTYKLHAKNLLLKDKRKHAMNVYEKLLSLDLDPLEKKEVQQSLLQLYSKLGKINDFYSLRKSISA